MIELERTFLAKKIPSGIKKCKFKEIIDIYVPKESAHPKIRIRKNGDKFEITKKEPVDGDFSRLHEQTIILNEEEFNSFLKIEGKKVRKIRYYYPYMNFIAEIDVFLDSLKGLVLVDFEFENEDDKNNFQMPDFCLAEVTDDEIIAGGFLCGKSYSDIEKGLEKYRYERIIP